jgi:exosortase K
MKNKIALSALILGLCILFKWLFAEADADRLDWLLRPASALVSLCTGIPFIRYPGEGYGNELESILIAPACSGLNFFIILSATGLCLAVWHLDGMRRTLGWGITGVCAAYAVSLAVNTLRIVLAIVMYKGNIQGLPLDAEQLHRVEGVVVYYVCLCVFVMAFSSVLQRVNNKNASGEDPVARNSGTCAGVCNKRRTAQGASSASLAAAIKVLLPLLCYLLFTLGIPLVNGAIAKAPDAFIEHCLTVLLLSAALSSLFYLLYRKKDRAGTRDA